MQLSNVVKEGDLCNIPITFSGYHSHYQDPNDVHPRASIGILYNKAATMAMQKHSMTGAYAAFRHMGGGRGQEVNIREIWRFRGRAPANPQ